MNRVPVRLAAFTVVLTIAFGAAYALGAATDDETTPVPTEHDEHSGRDTGHDSEHDTGDTQP